MQKRALNEVEAGQSRLGQMSKGSKITTHRGEKTTTRKQDRKVQRYNDEYTDIFDFKSDENMMLDDVMDIGDVMGRWSKVRKAMHRNR